MRSLAALSLAVMLGTAGAAPVQAAPTDNVFRPDASGPSRAEIERLLQEADARVRAGDAAGARRLAEQAAASGDPDALNVLAAYVATGVGAPADEARAVTLYERAVAAGSPWAMINLGSRLVREERTAAEQRRGIQLLTLAYGDPRVKYAAAAELGVAYMFGVGVAEDLPRGAALLEEAEAGGNTDAYLLYMLGRTYEEGWGGRTPDPVRAHGYHFRAAQQGNARSAWVVGMNLLNGTGVAKNEAEAYRWVRRSGEAGDLRGQISTAVMLALGQGTAENDVEARAWYRKAAEAGSAHGLRGLGIMIYTGEGGAADPAMGYAYLQLASAGGDENAGRILERIPAPSDRAAVEGHKAAWIAAHGKPGSDD